jgi:hypothetical protein
MYLNLRLGGSGASPLERLALFLLSSLLLLPLLLVAGEGEEEPLD